MITDRTSSGVAHDSSRNTPSQFTISTWKRYRHELISVPSRWKLKPSRVFVKAVTVALPLRLHRLLQLEWRPTLAIIALGLCYISSLLHSLSLSLSFPPVASFRSAVHQKHLHANNPEPIQKLNLYSLPNPNSFKEIINVCSILWLLL